MARIKKRLHISKFPRHVGVLVDVQYKKPEWVLNLIREAKPRTVFTTTTGFAMEGIIEKTVVLRGDLFFKLFEPEAWETRAEGRGHAIRLRDYLFMSYLKFNKGLLLIFPAQYQTNVGLTFSKRMQNMIFLAHQLDVNYDIIMPEEEEED